MANELIITEDGSHSLLSNKFGVTYHSKYGALAESMHVFINAGLNYFKQSFDPQSIRIFEMGFGTGLNALLTYHWTCSESIIVDYHTIEKYPIQFETVGRLNFTDQINAKNLSNDFTRMHKVATNQKIVLSSNFSFTKFIDDLNEMKIPSKNDIIYFDAFAPSTQQELWDLPVLSKLYDSLNQNGCLVTFCAKGSFKRSLKEVGFMVEAIPGPNGKREMTRAHKS